MADVVERWRANRAALAELAIEPRELARRVDLLEHEVGRDRGRAPPTGRGRRDPVRLAAAQHGEAIARGAAAVHEALAGDGDGRPRSGGHRGPRGTRPGPARPAVRGGSPSAWPASRPSSTTSPPRSATLADDDRPRPGARSPRSRSGSATIFALERRYGDDEAAVIAHGERAAAELERLARARRGAGHGARREDARSAGARSRSPRPRCPTRGGRPRHAPRRAPSARRSRSSASRPASFEVALGAGAAGRGRAGDRARRRRGRLRRQRRRPGRLPARPEPRRAGPAARADRLGRRAVARRARDQAGPRRGRRHARRSSSTRSIRGSAAGARTRSGAACGRSPGGTRSCA